MLLRIVYLLYFNILLLGAKLSNLFWKYFRRWHVWVNKLNWLIELWTIVSVKSIIKHICWWFSLNFTSSKLNFYIWCWNYISFLWIDCNDREDWSTILCELNEYSSFKISLFIFFELSFMIISILYFKLVILNNFNFYLFKQNSLVFI